MRSKLASSVCTLALLASGLQAQEATFDGQPEGTTGLSITDGGFTFTSLDQGLGTAPDPFFIEDATNVLNGELYFFQPNALGFGSHVPGGDAVLGRIQSFRILPTPPIPALFIHCFVSRAQAGNAIHFEGRVGGTVVSSGSVTIPPGTDVFTFEAFLTNSPDEILVYSTGPVDGGTFHALVDMVGPGAIDYFDFILCGGGGPPTTCPCGNTTQSIDLEGCASSLGYGARLRAAGAADVSADSLVLLGSQMPNSSALYFQGTTLTSSYFGDGRRCAGGSVLRLGTKMNAAGASQYPEAGDVPIAQMGLVPPGGGTRLYQVWYRNAASFCTSQTFNLSNAVNIFWYP